MQACNVIVRVQPQNGRGPSPDQQVGLDVGPNNRSRSHCSRHYRHPSRSKFSDDNYKRKSASYSSISITESSESDFSSYKRPYEQSDDDFPRNKKQKRHQGSAADRHQSSVNDRYQSNATDTHQSRAADMPQRSGHKCCENTEPDMSQEQENTGPLCS